MANMAYCRFENTLQALRDCYDNMDEPTGKSEEAAKEKLVRLCALIASEYGKEQD